MLLANEIVIISVLRDVLCPRAPDIRPWLSFLVRNFHQTPAIVAENKLSFCSVEINDLSVVSPVFSH